MEQRLGYVLCTERNRIFTITPMIGVQTGRTPQLGDPLRAQPWLDQRVCADLFAERRLAVDLEHSLLQDR